MNCLLLGNRSDIAMGLKPLLEADGYKVAVWNRDHKNNYKIKCRGWDLAIVALGSVAPVGLWWHHTTKSWEDSIKSNLLLPMRLLRANWATHRPNASICFLAGSNPNMITDGYSGYNVGKMGLLKACEQLDHETPDAKFFCIGPGIILTKIHKASEYWSNPKLEKARLTDFEGNAPKIKRVYECLQWCLRQPKDIVGGRNICVSDSEDWGNEKWLVSHLYRTSSMFKLRRAE